MSASPSPLRHCPKACEQSDASPPLPSPSHPSPPSPPSPPRSLPLPLMAQCRFCLAEESASELVEPCACIGSSRLVHLHCLRNWQRHQLRATCEVCRAPWKFPLDQVERNSWLRSLKTNPHYRSMQPGALSLASEQNLRERMRPGTLILQTPAQAAEVTPILRPILDPSHTEVIAILASALQSRTSHWFKVCPAPAPSSRG